MCNKILKRYLKIRFKLHSLSGLNKTIYHASLSMKTGTFQTKNQFLINGMARLYQTTVLF